MNANTIELEKGLEIAKGWIETFNMQIVDMDIDGLGYTMTDGDHTISCELFGDFILREHTVLGWIEANINLKNFDMKLYDEFLFGLPKMLETVGA